MEMIDVLDRGCLCNLQPGKPLEEQRQHDVELQTGKRRTDAEMDAGAEGEIGALVA